MTAPSSKNLPKGAAHGWDDTNKVWVPLAVGADGTLEVDISESPSTSVSTALVTVSVAGTPVQLPDLACERVFVQGLETNKGRVCVGDSNVDAATYQGSTLYPTQGDWFKVSNSNLLYVDAAKSGDKIALTYEIS